MNDEGENIMTHPCSIESMTFLDIVLLEKTSLGFSKDVYKYTIKTDELFVLGFYGCVNCAYVEGIINFCPY